MEVSITHEGRTLAALEIGPDGSVRPGGSAGRPAPQYVWGSKDSVSAQGQPVAQYVWGSQGQAAAQYVWGSQDQPAAQYVWGSQGQPSPQYVWGSQGQPAPQYVWGATNSRNVEEKHPSVVGEGRAQSPVLKGLQKGEEQINGGMFS